VVDGRVDSGLRTGPMARTLHLNLLCLLGLAACQDPESPQPRGEPYLPPSSMEAPSEPRPAAPAPAGASAIRGTVVETMNSGGYTYVKLDAGAEEEIWAAGLSTQVAVGDEVSIQGGMLMQDFESKTLERTFEDIYFARALQVVGQGSGAEPAVKVQVTPQAVPTIDVEKVEGGHTVAEIYEGAEALAGREVVVRGQVVKFNGAIMDKNWIHIRDGTGTTGSNDLTVTTDATADVGDVVVVRGRLATNKDFGAGYSYQVIVEDASVTK